MISDKDTNTIYFSSLLREESKYSRTIDQIIHELGKINIAPKFLPNTRDIWARDYMPIQISGDEYIEYRYDPDYLQGKRKGTRNLKSYPDIIVDSIGLRTIKSDVIMDGGNFVKSRDCVIMTDKVIKENQQQLNGAELTQIIKETFKVDKLIIIPQDKFDIYGHTDGMVRFIDDNTVLVNHHYRNDSKILDALKTGGLKVKFIEYSVKKEDTRNWAYLNFLQTEQLILLPKFGIDEDQQAFDQMEYFYPSYISRIIQINMADIVKYGGALNCISWTTKE